MCKADTVVLLEEGGMSRVGATGKVPMGEQVPSAKGSWEAFLGKVVPGG